MAGNKNILTSLDIGSNQVRMVVGQILPDGRIKVIAAADTPSQGISKGNIVNLEDAVSCISETVEKCERMSNVRVEKTIVGISGANIRTVMSKGLVAVAKANSQVEQSDIERALDLAEKTTTLPNYEVLHTLPVAYNLDEQKNIKDPLGMTGIRLEAEAQVVMVLSSQMKSIEKCLYRAGLDYEEAPILSILATAEAVLTTKQKESGVAVVNIGASLTSMVVFEEGVILHTAVLPVGAGYITNDLAIGLKTSIDIAEVVKLDHAQALSENISKREEVDLHKYSEAEPKGSYVFKKDIAHIAEARMEEIFEMIDTELKKIDRSGKLPSGIILTGGGAKLPLIVELAKKVLNLPVFLGRPSENNFILVVDKVNDMSYTTALGLLLLARNNMENGGGLMSKIPNIFQGGSRISGWLKSLWPSN